VKFWISMSKLTYSVITQSLARRGEKWLSHSLGFALFMRILARYRIMKRMTGSPKLNVELKKDGLRRCCRCREIKDINLFRGKHQTIQYPYCITCAAESHRETDRKRTIYNKFNITKEDHQKLILDSNNKCKICKQPESHINYTSKKTLSLTVDHCHTSGLIRGLICRSCNLMLGNAKDSIKTLRAAIRYLQQPKELTNE